MKKICMLSLLALLFATGEAQATEPRVEPQWNVNMLGCEEWSYPGHDGCAGDDHCNVHTFDKYYGTHEQALEAVRMVHAAFGNCAADIMHITHRGTRDGEGWEWDVWELYFKRDRICRRIDDRPGHRHYQSWEPACYEER